MSYACYDFILLIKLPKHCTTHNGTVMFLHDFCSSFMRSFVWTHIFFFLILLPQCDSMHEFWQHSHSDTIMMNMTSEHMSSHAHAISQTSNEFKIEFNEIPANKIKHVSNIFVRCNISSYAFCFTLTFCISREIMFVIFSDHFFVVVKFGFCHHKNKWKIYWKYFRWWKNLLFLSMIFSIQVFLNWKPFLTHLKKKSEQNRVLHLNVWVFFPKSDLSHQI